MYSLTAQKRHLPLRASEKKRATSKKHYEAKYNQLPSKVRLFLLLPFTIFFTARCVYSGVSPPLPAIKLSAGS